MEQTQTVVVTDDDIDRLRLLLEDFLGEEPLAFVTFSDGYIRTHDIGKLCELENSKPEIRSLSLTSKDDEARGEITISNAEDDNISIRLSIQQRLHRMQPMYGPFVRSSISPLGFLLAIIGLVVSFESIRTGVLMLVGGSLLFSWKWVFPRTCFRIGHGDQRYHRLAFLRGSVLTGLVLAIGSSFFLNILGL